jgi:deoxyadenosine/deoxycytidine kinase
LSIAGETKIMPSGEPTSTTLGSAAPRQEGEQKATNLKDSNSNNSDEDRLFVSRFRSFVKQYVCAPAVFCPPRKPLASKDATMREKLRNRIYSYKGLIGTGKTTTVEGLAKYCSEVLGVPAVAITEKINTHHLQLFYTSEKQRAEFKKQNPGVTPVPANPYAFPFQIDMLWRCHNDMREAMYMTGRGPARKHHWVPAPWWFRLALLVVLSFAIAGTMFFFGTTHWMLETLVWCTAAFLAVLILRDENTLISYMLGLGELDGGYVVFLDGNLSTNVVFAAMHAAGDNIRSHEWPAYLEGAHELGPCELDGVVHLTVTPEQAQERIRKRSRKGEEGLPLAYLESLDRSYALTSHEQLMAGQTREIAVDNSGEPDFARLLELMVNAPSAEEISRRYKANILKKLELPADIDKPEERIETAISTGILQLDGKTMLELVC